MEKSHKVELIGRPSIDRPWMKYYPESISRLQVPELSLNEKRTVQVWKRCFLGTLLREGRYGSKIYECHGNQRGRSDSCILPFCS